jgi:fructose-1,6-bisphosphatase I
MFKTIPTLTDQILHEQKTHKRVTAELHFVLLQIENSVKIIASHVRASGLVDILGKTGNTNTFGEEVQKLDEFANQLLIDRLLTSGYVYAVISEEEKEPIYAKKEHAGDYIIYFDPLDGSSNIDTNSPIGTIFSIYHKDGGILQQGNKQLAAGYSIYGSSVMFVYSVGHGVNGFTYDPSIGSFLLSHPDMKLPDEGDIYSINEGYLLMFDKPVQQYITHIKESKKMRCRFVGSLVADAQRTFIKGGIFLYPSYEREPKGKLRLMLEVNPFAFLTEQAGGIALGKDNKSPLLTPPKHIHETSPFIMGSKKNVEDFLG